MPTDVNNLTDGQRVPAWVTIADCAPMKGPNVLVAGLDFERITIPRADIITDWPPEPSADEAGWEELSAFLPNGLSFNDPLDFTKYEYRIHRRPIAPKWVPTVGERAMWRVDGKNWQVVAIDRGLAWIWREAQSQFADVSSLTQPKEGGQ